MAAPPRKRVSRKKIILAVLIAIVLAVVLPPQINGARFSKRLASALSQALGRQVRIGSIKFRLLPRPGFDLYDFEVVDDPAFNAEPLLLCGQVTADLRLTSLWKGRLEIANLKLHNATDRTPPSLNLVYAGGHWNVESLLSRVEQVPSAPTAKRSTEQRSRFPYIEADAGRINIKIGPEKKPYALVNTDFAFWLAAEDQWHLRLEGRPVRTDMNLSDTGTLKMEGDLRRASNLHDLPVKLQVTWQEAQLGQLSSLVLGYDKGWRGGLDLNLKLDGSPSDLHITAEADLQDFRRYDITRREALSTTTRCLGQYDLTILHFDCNTPVQGGALRLTGGFAPQGTHDYDLSLALNRVPLAALVMLARHAKRGLPDDLTASGEVNAAFGFHSHQGAPVDWHGTGMTSNFLLASSLASKPIPVSAIRFHIGAMEMEKNSVVLPAIVSRRVHLPPKKSAHLPPPGSISVDPFSIQLGTASPVQANVALSSQGYSIALKGLAPLDRLLELGKITGYPSRIADTTGTADLDLTASEAWDTTGSAKLIGSTHLANVKAKVPGIQEPLLLSAADVQFTETEVVLSHIAAQFEHSTVGFGGSVSKAVACGNEPSCTLQFDLHAPALGTADVAEIFGLNHSKWNLPFLSGPGIGQFPDFRASGTLSLGTLKLVQLPVEKFVAHLELEGHALAISRINGKVSGGNAQGEWRIDWSSTPIRYSGTGLLAEVASDHLLLSPAAEALLASWISGKTSLKYSVNFTGQSTKDMLASIKGEGDLVVLNGVSRALALNITKPMIFQSLVGKLELDHELLKIRSSKLKSENRIYDLSGVISLSDQQAKLKMSGNASQWEVTGSLDKAVGVSPEKTASQATTQGAAGLIP
ncbi:MAG TPA: AsmA family protein [Candidatus Angelobacter sp.]|nr:AsmA family protein [Candidatus Angelobacter sp.]